MKYNHATHALPRLFVKPAENTVEPGIFSRSIPELKAEVSFRSLDLSLDLDLIHGWVNKAYAQRFWQLSGSRSTIENIYRAILENPQAHSFIGLIGEKPVCQIDVYAVLSDELGNHIDATAGDCGLHLLMCPPREMERGWSFYLLRLFQAFYFSFPEAKGLFAEPDQDNHTANQLAINTGFHFLKTIELSYKTANLYCLHREDYRPV